MQRSFVVIAVTLTACTAFGSEQTKDKEDDGEPSNKPKEYTIAATVAPEGPAVGAQAELKITITPFAPWVLKKETPFAIALAPSDGVTLTKKAMTAKDFVDPNAPAKTIKTALVASAPGAQKVAADMSFFLCTEVMCKRMKNKLEVNFQAK